MKYYCSKTLFRVYSSVSGKKVDSDLTKSVGNVRENENDCELQAASSIMMLLKIVNGDKSNSSTIQIDYIYRKNYILILSPFLSFNVSIYLVLAGCMHMQVCPTLKYFFISFLLFWFFTHL